MEKEDDFPQLLDLISKDRKWPPNGNVTGKTHNSEDRKLELRLGLPGGDEAPAGKVNSNEREESFLSHCYFPHLSQKFSHSENPWPNLSAFRFSNEASKKPFPPSDTPSQKRTAPAPVVGWPPIRTSRRNLASSSFSKPAPSPGDGEVAGKVAGEKGGENGGKGLFVKINMDGVPIGRKVDLKAYDSYEKLSSAVDELFRGLLAAQKDPSAGAGGGVSSNQEAEKPISGLLDGTGEYTLVYEDNEGDRVLVGDVPWRMFVSTVKRLRVLKSSELPLSLGSSKAQKMVLDSAAK